MNPLVILLLATVANNNRQSLPFNLESFKLDGVLDQLHTTVDALEKVNQLSQIGKASNSFSLPAPSAPAVSAPPAPIEQAPPPTPEPTQSAQPFPNIDLQSAMQTLGPLLSMMGNGQNPK